MAANPDSPVGVFDSGIGGLTVLQKIIEALPRENTVYLGDTAKRPMAVSLLRPSSATRSKIRNF